MSLLKGVRVLDLSRVLGGPYCGQILADMGAEVIKIEPPTGDETRLWGPPFVEGTSAYFEGANRGKKNLGLNLEKPEGRKIFLRLLETADVVLENFKPGTMARWGIDYETHLAPLFPRLIYFRLSGFGESGPLSKYPGYDAALQGWSGLMSVNGTPDAGPQRLGVPIVDLASGLYAAIGISAALYRREKSGKGERLGTSLFATGLSLMHPHGANFLMGDIVGKPTGSAHTNICPYDLFQTKTVPLFLAVGNNRQFAKLAQILGRPELADDPRFLENATRLKHREELKVELENLLARWDGLPLAEKLLSEGVPCGPVLNIEQALAHPQTKALGLRVHDKDYQGIGSPLEIHGAPLGAPTTRAPERLSESAFPILRDHGFSEAEITRFIKESAVAAPAKSLDI